MIRQLVKSISPKLYGFIKDVYCYSLITIMKKRRIRIPFLVVVVGQACSLKCKDCGNFAPYAHKDNLVYNFEDIIAGLERVKNAGFSIDLLQIQGGEPFVYPYLNKILDYVIGQRFIKSIEIATNGTIIPDKYVSFLKNAKIAVRISDYGDVNREKAQYLCTFLKENGVEFYYYNFVHQNTKWSKCGEIDQEQFGCEEAKLHFAKCGFRSCLTFEKNLFGKCSRSIHAKSIQGFVTKKEDYVDVNSDMLRKELLYYMKKCNEDSGYYMEACRYCLGTYYGELIEPAIQIK